MHRRSTDRQPDLFGDSTACEAVATGVPAPPADFIDRIRGELAATLAQVEQAAELPWSAPSKAMLAEMRFHSIANWLPAAEASHLRERFDTELKRLYREE